MPARPSFRTARSLTLRALSGALLIGTGLTAVPGVASAGDRPAGYYFGTDSNYPSAQGVRPYQEPTTGGLYSSYTAEVGTWTDWKGCTTGQAINLANVAAVNANESVAPGIPGLSLYWFMAGPGADAHYNATTTEAYAWGRAQGEAAEADYHNLVAHGIRTETKYTPMMYMDIEGQPAAGYANGWNEVVNSCGQITKKQVIPPAVDRATFNGFYDYMHISTIFRPGVYSTPYFWNETFGTGPFGTIPNTYEWTPEVSTLRAVPGPVGFTQGGLQAQWFGGVNVAHQVGWQWTQRGGDYDQINTAHLPT